MRNDLHRRPEVVTPAFLGDDTLIDTTGRVVAVPPTFSRANEALVMAEVQVRFGTVVGNENFTVLEWTHSSRIHVDVWIQLDHADGESARLENRTKAG
jgi:hypothetical protein